MAKAIAETAGRDALVGTVSNPFAFFVLYSQAARRKGAGAPVFSKKAIEFIRLLGKRYME